MDNPNNYDHRKFDGNPYGGPVPPFHTWPALKSMYLTFFSLFSPVKPSSRSQKLWQWELPWDLIVGLDKVKQPGDLVQFILQWPPFATVLRSS